MVREVVLGVAVLWQGLYVSNAQGPAFQSLPPEKEGPGHKLEVRDSALASRVLAGGGRLIANYGSFELYQVTSVSMELAAYRKVSLRDEYNWIRLNVGPLDTTQPGAQAQRNTIEMFQGKRLHLVQFAGPILPAWRTSLLNCGVQIIAYIPHNCYLVYGDSDSLAAINALALNSPVFQWQGPYLDRYKIHPRALAFSSQGVAGPETEPFAIQLVADTKANPSTLQLLETLKLEPLQTPGAVLNYVNIVARLSPDHLNEVAARPDVVSIQPYVLPKKLCERQAQIVAGNLSGGHLTGPGYLAWLASKGFTQEQFKVSGFSVDVSDSGIDNGTTSPGHFGLFPKGDIAEASRVVYARLEGMRSLGSTLAGCDGHGTLNAHVIGGYDDLNGFPFSDAEGYHYGLGICPFVKLGSSVIFDPDNFTSPNFNTLQAHAYQAGARISNNSWGSDVAGLYDMNAQQFDALVRNAQPSGGGSTATSREMVILFAAGNDGPTGQSMDSPASAKNVISVGGGENQQAIGGADSSGVGDDQADDGEDILSFSSRGPCADLRHKPDLIAPGTHVSGGVAQASNPAVEGTALACYNGTGVSGGAGGIFFPASQQLYTTSSGTSHATPCVSGGCALLRQYFINEFTTPPSPAMTKAYLMNSARYMTGLYANDTLWSDSQGMGEMDLGMAFDGVPRLLRDELAADLFTASGQVRSFSGSIFDTNKPFRVTLAWTDAPGSTTGDAYNNDLDLTVTIGDNTYKGNVFTGAVSATGGTADFRNNVESVFLRPGSAGAFVITVTAANINSDGVPGNASALDQDFALVVYNATQLAPPFISLEPTNQTSAAGANVRFEVLAEGTPPLSYQWHFNGVALGGETSSELILTNVQANQMGGYWVTVTNSAGWKSSSEAWLKVLVPPTLSKVIVTATNALIELNSVSGLTYTLQYKNVLSGSQWLSLPSPITGNGGTISLLDINPSAVSRFYRVLVN